MMTTGTSVMILGSAVTLLGGAGVLWRFFMLRTRRSLRGRMFRVPPYWVAAVVMVLGVVLQAQSLMLFPGTSPSIVSWFLSGISLGSCLAVPGVVLAVSGWGAIDERDANPRTAPRPWRAKTGMFLVIVGFFGGLAWPLTLLILAIRHH